MHAGPCEHRNCINDTCTYVCQEANPVCVFHSSDFADWRAADARRARSRRSTEAHVRGMAANGVEDAAFMGDVGEAETSMATVPTPSVVPAEGAGEEPEGGEEAGADDERTAEERMKAEERVRRQLRLLAPTKDWAEAEKERGQSGSDDEAAPAPPAAAAAAAATGSSADAAAAASSLRQQPVLYGTFALPPSSALLWQPGAIPAPHAGEAALGRKEGDEVPEPGPTPASPTPAKLSNPHSCPHPHPNRRCGRCSAIRSSGSRASSAPCTTG